MCFAAAAAGSGLLSSLSTAATIGGTLLSAYTLYQNNQAQAKSLEAQAVRQQISANQAIQQGEDESTRRRRAGAAQSAANVAAMASNGVDVTSAQALDVIDDDKFLVEEDAFSIRENARRVAQGFEDDAANSRTQASSARSSALFEPVGTLLTGAAKVGEQYAQWQVNKRLQSQELSGAF